MSNESVLLSYEKMMKSFLTLMHHKNPNLKMSFHTSFDDFKEEYKEGKFAAQAHKQSGNPEFIVQVNEDFELPFEEYEIKELICTSWRNNGYTGGLPEDVCNKQREELPSDFDVVRISGNPLEKQSLNSFAVTSLIFLQ